MTDVHEELPPSPSSYFTNLWLEDVAPALRLLLGSPSTSVSTKDALCNINLLLGVCAIDNPLSEITAKWLKPKSLQSSVSSFPMGNSSSLPGPVVVGHAAAPSCGPSLCTLHISLILLDTDAEELVCCEYPTRGRRCQSPFHSGSSNLYPVLLMMPPAPLTWLRWEATSSVSSRDMQ